MPKIIPLGQKLWPTGRGQTHRRTEKANTEDPFFRKNFFWIFDFLLKERSENKTKQKIISNEMKRTKISSRIE